MKKKIVKKIVKKVPRKPEASPQEIAVVEATVAPPAVVKEKKPKSPNARGETLLIRLSEKENGILLERSSKFGESKAHYIRRRTVYDPE